MIADREWTALQAAWTSEAPRTAGAPAAGALLAKATSRVRRESRRLIACTLLDVAVTLFIFAFSVFVASNVSEPRTWVAAVAVWIFAGSALVFSVRNRRGLWRAVSGTTRSFVEISIRRCEAELRAVAYGRRLLAVELIFIFFLTVWKVASKGALPAGETASTIVFLVAITVLTYAFLHFRERRFRAELAEWRRFEGVSSP